MAEFGLMPNTKEIQKRKLDALKYTHAQNEAKNARIRLIISAKVNRLRRAQSEKSDLLELKKLNEQLKQDRILRNHLQNNIFKTKMSTATKRAYLYAHKY